MHACHYAVLLCVNLLWQDVQSQSLHAVQSSDIHQSSESLSEQQKMERNKAPQSSAAIVKGSTCAWCTHRIVGRSANQWVDHKSINYWNIKNRIQQDGRSAPIPSVMASLWSGLRLCRLHEVLPSKSSQIVSHLKTNQNTKCCWYHEDLTSDTAGLGKAKLKCFKSSCQKEKSGFDLDFYKPTSIWIW